MKRRDFIKTSAMAGGSVGVASSVGACAPGGQQAAKEQMVQAIYLKGEQPEVTLLQELDNDHLHVKIFSNASLEILDKKSSYTWRSGPVALQELGEIEQGHVWLREDRSMCEQYPGRFMGERAGDAVRFTLLGRQDRIWGAFSCRFSLEEEWLVLDTGQIDDSIPSLVFPPPIDSDELILPRGIGQLVKDRESRSIYNRKLFTFYTRLNMRFIGGQKEDHAWMGVFDEGFQDACCLAANGTVSPGYLKSLGKWSHSYRMKYKFMKGNYVEVARAYREDFKARGWFKPLTEKIRQNPSLKKNIGGRSFWISLAHPGYRKEFTEGFLLRESQFHGRKMNEVHVHLTYKDLKRFIGRLQEHGLEKGFLKVAGWINGGYDASHPDVWPPEPALGSLVELKEIMGMDAPFLLGLHDNYQDIYETTDSFPEGVCRWKDGSLQTGGAWAGGQAYILHGTASLEYARRNWEKIRTLGPGAMMVDTITAQNLYQSFEKGKERTKLEDYQAKLAMMKFYKDQGTLFGSEEVADFAIPHIDWFETRHHRVQGETIPLWPLVFHDAALLMSYGSGMPAEAPGDASAHASGEAQPVEWLEAMQWGYMLHFHYRDNFDFKRFSGSFHVDKWHEKVALAEMTRHEFLDNEMKVEKTEFSSGHSIICNYGTEPVSAEGGVIRGMGYRTLS
jgi:hypothetical protein